MTMMRIRRGNFFAIRGFSVSSGENVLAFATDTVGRRIYTVRFKDLESGEILDDEIRRQLSPRKLMTGRWLEIVRTAHEVGLRSSSTSAAACGGA